jgi:CRP-like cAMP-binding protein
MKKISNNTTENSSKWYLESFDILEFFCPKKSDHSSIGHYFKKFAEGDIVYQPGQKAEEVYVISSGHVKVTSEKYGGRSITKAYLGRGEVFGELALVGSNERRYYAIAMEHTEICVISKDHMAQLFKKHGPIYVYIMSIIGRRAVEHDKKLESLVFKDSRSRILDYLIDLNDRKGQRVGYEWVIHKFKTNQEIANMTATSRQTVNRVLNELKAKNLLTSNRRRLLIRDLSLLSENRAAV